MSAVLLTNQTALALAGFALVGVGISNVIPALIRTPFATSTAGRTRCPEARKSNSMNQDLFFPAAMESR